MKKKYRYIYDKKSGHFIKKLNEDNTAQQTTGEEKPDGEKPEEKTTEEKPATSFKSIDSNEDIQKLNKRLSDIKQRYDNDMAMQNKTLDAAKIAASKKDVVGEYDPVMTDDNVLMLLKKINDLTKKYNKDVTDIEDQRISLLSKLAQAKESYYNVPDKYKYLTESNIHTAKIYMRNLVGTDGNQILKGMADFKRVFKNTNLLYGKDRDGYFIVALDSDDFNEATEALEEVGYLRDEVLDTIMPQVLDRHTMIQ